MCVLDRCCGVSWTESSFKRQLSGIVFSLKHCAAHQLECVILSCVFQTSAELFSGWRLLLRETLLLSIDGNSYKGLKLSTWCFIVVSPKVGFTVTILKISSKICSFFVFGPLLMHISLPCLTMQKRLTCRTVRFSQITRILNEQMLFYNRGWWCLPPFHHCVQPMSLLNLLQMFPCVPADGGGVVKRPPERVRCRLSV